MAPPPDKPAWDRARPKTILESLGSASFGNPRPYRESVPTVDKDRALIQSTTDTLKVNQCKTVAIWGKLFEPLQQFIAHGDLVKEVADQKKEIADLKVVNCHLWMENKQ